MIPPRPRSIIPGSAACESCMTAPTFSRISRASASRGSSANLPYVPMPALLTRRSIAGSADASRASTTAIPFFEVRSAARTSTAVPCSFSSVSASSSSLVSSRATTTRSSPRAASARANAAPMPDEPPVTSATGLTMFMPLPPGSQAELGRHRVGRGVDRRPHVDLVHGALRVLQAVASERAHDGLVHPDLPRRGRLEQAGYGRRRRRFDEATLRRRQQAVRVEDLAVRDGTDVTTRLVAGADRLIPVRGVADANSGGDGLRVRDGLAVHQGSRSLRLPSEHPWPAVRAAVHLVFEIALPVGADVQGVPDGDAVRVGRLSQRVDHLEGGGLLPFDPERVDRVDDRDPAALGQLSDHAEGVVEVPPNRDDTGAV